VKGAWPIAAILVVLWTSSLFGEPEPAVTINPVMTKGPASAPVTIVEFSDYQ
jgi:hypothetical protein